MMETSRPINHENEATSSSTIYCNNASIIQNPNIRYDLKSSTSPSSSIQSHRPVTTTLNRDNGCSDRSNFHTLHYDNRKQQQQQNHQSMAMTNDIIVTNRKMHPTTASTATAAARNFNRYSNKSSSHSTRNMHSHDGNGGGGINSDSYSSKSAASSYGSTCTDSSCEGSETSSTSGEPNLPYPGFPELSLRYLTQTTRPRNYCLLLITNPWFERISILVILFNCVTLGMYQPCVDDECVTNRCKILQVRTTYTNSISN